MIPLYNSPFLRAKPLKGYRVVTFPRGIRGSRDWLKLRERDACFPLPV